MAKIASALESHSAEPTLSYENPAFGAFACFHQHEPKLPSVLQKAIERAAKKAKYLNDLARSTAIDYKSRAILRTTQALVGLFFTNSKEGA